MAVLHFPGFQHFWSLLKALLDLKAPLESPELTGDPTAPTQEPHDNSTKVATTEYVDNAVAELVNSSPAALDTLKELSDAIGGDANFSTTMTNALALKAPLASPALTGSPTAPTQNAGDNSTKIATTAYADRNDAACVHLAGAETVSGTKTFTAYPVLHGTGPVFGLSASEYVKGTNPATQRWGGVHFIDKTKDTATTKRAGSLEFTVATNGQTEAWLRAYNWVSGSNARGDLGIIYPKDGTPYTQAPTPAAGDNSTKIATTAFVTTAVANEDATCVHLTGNETIAGTKTFSSTITGSVSGNAGTATKINRNADSVSHVQGCQAGKALVSTSHTGYGAIWNAPTKSCRVSLATYPSNNDIVYLLSCTNANVSAGTNTIHKSVQWDANTGTLSATSFSGPLVGNVTGNCSGSSGSCTGNAKTATTLATARDINISDADGTNTGTKISFNGSANGTIKLPATIKASITGNCSGSSGSCTGNAATATKTTATIAVDTTGELVHAQMGSNDLFRIAVGGGSNAGWAEIATGDDYSEPIYVRQYQGSFATLKRTATLLDGSGNTSFPGTVTANSFSGPLVGNVTGNCSGNAASATKLAPQGGTALPTANLAVDGLQMVEVYNNSYPTNYGNVINVQGSAHKGAGQLLLGWSGTNNGIANIYYRNKRDAATTWSDWKTVAFTDSNITGSSGSCTGNAKTATTLHTARDINISDADGTNTGTKISFNGSANGTIKLPATIKASITGNCSGSSGSCTGNAATATTLKTARKINGVSFNGSADITVADSTKLPLAGGTVTGATYFTTDYYRKDTGAVKGTAPSANRWQNGVRFIDNNNVAFGGIERGFLTDKTCRINMIVYKGTTTNTSDNAQIGVGYDKDGNWFTYAPTPAAADDSTKIATTAWCRDATGNFACNAATATTLHTARKINGVSFNGSADITVADSTKVAKTGDTMTGSLTQKHTGLVKGNTVAKWTCRDYRVIDNSGDSGDKPCISWWRTAVDTNKNVSVTLNAFKFADESTTSASIGIHYPASGDPYTSAPTPAAADNSTKIATTAFCKDFIKSLSVSGRTITYTKSTGTTGTITTQDSDTTYGVFGVNYNGLVPGVSDYYKEMDFILTANGKWRSDYQSDRRVKQDFENIPEELIDIWGEVKWHQFLFKDEVKNRGENAKIHAGLVVQDLHELYEKHGIDIKKYAFTLHDLREAVPAVYDDGGNLVCSEQEAVDVWCLKYHEALAFEALYLRKKIRLLEERLARVESKVN